MTKINVTTIGAIAVAPIAAGASGQIVYTELGPITGNISIGGPMSSSTTLGLDFNNDNSDDMRIRRNISSGQVKLYIDGDSANGQGANSEDEIIAEPTSVDGLNPVALEAGDLIDGSANFRFASNDLGSAGESDIWRSTGTGLFPVDSVERFIGVRTVLDGNTVFGWIGIVLTSEQTGTGGFVTGYVSGHAYEASGGPIVAGAIPAPAGAATLALGGLAFAGRRRVG
ncbi:MAG: hypothetical protein AAF747_11860 [Planctomycetota bacterium]